jgi:DNA polymerase-3 subunit chi
MTEVAFHFNAPDKIQYTCRLLRKACASAAQVVVVGAEESISALDAALWTFSATAFVPHCRSDADPAVLQNTPVLLMAADKVPQQWPHHQVLVNLGSELVAGFESFEKVIEVVTQDDQDKSLARLRWKHYADRGYPLVRHDLSPKA